MQAPRRTLNGRTLCRYCWRMDDALLLVSDVLRKADIEPVRCVALMFGRGVLRGRPMRTRLSAANAAAASTSRTPRTLRRKLTRPDSIHAYTVSG